MTNLTEEELQNLLAENISMVFDKIEEITKNLIEYKTKGKLVYIFCKSIACLCAASHLSSVILSNKNIDKHDLYDEFMDEVNNAVESQLLELSKVTSQ